jgi:hypothetical protein
MKITKSIRKCADFIKILRPKLSDIQAVAAAIELEKEVEKYLSKRGNPHPYLARAIYEAELTEDEYAAYCELPYDDKRKLIVDFCQEVFI